MAHRGRAREWYAPTVQLGSERTTYLAGRVVASAVGSSAAHAQLVERVLPRVLRYFQRLVGDQEAEDCLQETLLALEQSLSAGDYDPTRSYNAWLWLKARTVWAQWCRRREKRLLSLPEGAEPTEGAPRPGEDVAHRLDAEQLLAALRARLGDDVYETFLLYQEGELTQDEVAATVGCDPKTVRKRLKQAEATLERLRQP